MPQTIYKGPAGATLAQCRVEICSLFVHRREVTGTPKSRPWRLIWATGPDASTYAHAEGDWDGPYFRTMREAVAHGLRRYGETAARFSD